MICRGDCGVCAIKKKREVKLIRSHSGVMMQYNGYVGSVNHDHEDNIFFGKALGIRNLVSYEGSTMEEQMMDFREAVDFYLEMKESLNKASGDNN